MEELLLSLQAVCLEGDGSATFEHSPAELGQMVMDDWDNILDALQMSVLNR